MSCYDNRIFILQSFPSFSNEILYHFGFFLCLGECEEKLSCKDALGQFEIDKKELPSVEDMKLVELGLLLLLLNFFFIAERP